MSFLGPSELPIVHALFDALVAHEDGGLPDPRAIGAIAAYDRQLGRLPREDALLFRGLLRLLEWGPPLLDAHRGPRFWRRFTRLDLAARREHFERWSRSRLLPLRCGYVALKTLALLAYYAQPGAWPAMGYDGPWLGRVPVDVIPVPRPAGIAGPLPSAEMATAL